MGVYVDLSGKRFFKLTVIRRCESNSKSKEPYFLCVCECGVVIKARSSHLKSGGVKSCGCSTNNRTHGRCNTRTYNIWAGMIQRCTDKNSNNYRNYGARGITVCNRWKRFEKFYADMGEAPEGMQLDRVNNNKGYSKSNCRWASRVVQCNNRRDNVKISIFGKTKTAAQWAKDTGIHAARFYRFYSVSEKTRNKLKEKIKCNSI